MFSALRNLRRLDRDDVLDALGLERKHSAAGHVASALGFLALGMAVGAGVGLLLAPKPGAELRAGLKHRLRPSTRTAPPPEAPSQFQEGHA